MEQHSSYGEGPAVVEGTRCCHICHPFVKGMSECLTKPQRWLRRINLVETPWRFPEINHPGET